MDTEQTVAELRTWQQEHNLPLPRPIYDTAYLERCGVVVDLADGSYFEPHDDWHDFTLRWLSEMQRRGVPPTLDRLACAIHKANAHHYDQAICRAIALTILPPYAGAPHTACAQAPTLDHTEQACYAKSSRP